LVEFLSHLELPMAASNALSLVPLPRHDCVDDPLPREARPRLRDGVRLLR